MQSHGTTHGTPEEATSGGAQDRSDDDAPDDGGAALLRLFKALPPLPAVTGAGRRGMKKALEDPKGLASLTLLVAHGVVIVKKKR
jgi:hypothetical protein